MRAYYEHIIYDVISLARFVELVQFGSEGFLAATRLVIFWHFG
jgi:hypothetical protein